MRELSIFIDESGDFGPVEAHSPLYLLSLVFHDQSHDITPDLGRIHNALIEHGFPANHAIHTGPLIRREQDSRWMDFTQRRSLFRVLADFTRTCDITQQSWVFNKRELRDSDHLVTMISRELGAFIRSHYEYFNSWERIVVYYDNGQKELTNIVNSVFNAFLASVEVRKATPADYNLLQVADLCCTLTLLQTKIQTPGMGLSKSESDFFSTPRDSAERALKKGYFKMLDRKRFNA